ncbi:MAG: XisI protein [Nostocales cyanobacterium]|nr:MAG: XisI protein [Nostocales cyanobacterium]TAF18006.1 MAG: XisI protein [Nostocales cyanobacterium]
MDKLNEYPKLIKKILNKYIEICQHRPQKDMETFLIIDAENGHYIWMNLGWQNGERITGMTVYVRLKDGKFWIEEDWTENGIATDLVKAGVPKEDIVLAFHDPNIRQYTDFAVA